MKCPSYFILSKSTKERLMYHVGSFLSSFTGIALVAFFSFQYSNYPVVSHDPVIVPPLYTPTTTPPFLIASFGATAVLIYGEINSPLAQPKNTIGGQIISALVGVTVHQIFAYLQVANSLLWLQSALSVSLSITAMQLTGTTHPPGGATALISIIGGNPIHALGYWYVLIPVLAGTLILLLIAVIGNRVMGRPYPSGKGELLTFSWHKSQDSDCNVRIQQEPEVVIVVPSS